ncbi:MAG: hypothetical protein HY509_04420 [Acidobacteria bacterium]|nr:hypothetical protein [Acidobacteriota bacterium]
MPGPAGRCTARARMRGTFTPEDFAEILRDILITEKTGVLRLSRAGAWKRVWTFQGLFVASATSLAEESLAGFLAGRPELDANLSRLAPGPEGDPFLLARRLAAENPAAAEPVAAAMQAMTRAILASLFRWDSGEYELEEKEIDPAPFVPDALRTVESILHGIDSIPDFHRIEEVLGRVESGLKWNPVQYLPVEGLAFGPLEGFVISRIDGHTTVREICSLAPPQAEERTCRFLYGLLVLGIAGWDPPVNGARFQFRSLAGSVRRVETEEREGTERILAFYRQVSECGPFAILGVRETDTLEAVRAASQRLRDRFRPERFPERVRSERREELELIEAKILEAFLALQSIQANRARRAAAGEGGDGVNLLEVGQRRELAKTEPQAQQEQRTRLAEQFFQRAREALVMGDYHSAVASCEHAIRNNPAVAAYFALLANCQRKNPDHRWQKRAEENLQKAIELDPWVPDHHLHIAEFYLAHGMKRKAKRHLEKALEIQPDHPAARQELKRLR